MDNFTRIIFEHSGTIVLNNELTVTKFPFAIDYPVGADLVIDTLDEKFVFNPSSPHLNDSNHKVLKIKHNLYVIKIERKDSEKILRVIHASSHFIFPKRYVVEIGEGEHTSFFTIHSNKENKFAVDLGITLNNPSTTLQDNKIVINERGLSFIFDPQENKVLKHTKSFGDEIPLPFKFLQYLQNQEYDKASKLLSFETSDHALREYFGNFDILLNNYLQDANILSIIQNGVVKNLKFSIQDGKIQNVE